jgi:hypothetical protein
MTNTVLTMKQIELLNELLPSGKSIAIISDPNTEADDLEKNARHAEHAAAACRADTTVSSISDST